MAKNAYTLTRAIHEYQLLKRDRFSHSDMLKLLHSSITKNMMKFNANPTDLTVQEDITTGTDLFNVVQMAISLDEGKAVHLYMPDAAFCRWLIDCVPALLPEYTQVLETTVNHEIGVLHFPTSSGLSTTIFRPVSNVQCLNGGPVVQAGLFCFVYGRSHMEDLSMFAEFDGKTSKALSERVKSLRNNRADELKMIEYMKLVAGIALYTECFPEAVVNGIPSDLKHPSHHAYPEAITIGIVDKIKQSLGGTHASPRAHYRVGHFRTLRSERFTKKRFQVVFVDGVFVKGRAKTVLTPEAVDAEEEKKETYAFAASKADSGDTDSRVFQGTEAQETR